MRIIAGIAGGRNLLVPKSGVRPTMDRVKAAIFNMIGPDIEGARVLDLFAGSGGLGIEALSRGAASCVFVENHGPSVAIIKRNLESSKLPGGQVVASDVFRYLRQMGAGSVFDFILADPPYAKAPGERDFGSDLIAVPELASRLAPDGVLMLEQLPGTGPRENSGWVCSKIRRYGATEVAFFQKPDGPRLISES